MKPLFKALRVVIGILFAGFTAGVVTLFATYLYLEPQLPSVTHLRAAFELIRTGHKPRGGSTIPMQVARNFFLSCEKTFARKLKEIFLALKINRELTKQEPGPLLQQDLPGQPGLQRRRRAAQIYYGKNPDQLSPTQIAMIAGLPKTPSRGLFCKLTH